MTKSSTKWLLFLVFVLVTLSCAPTKNAAYFRKLKNEPNLNVPDMVYHIEGDSANHIRKGDQLYIMVTSGNDEPNSFSQRDNPVTDQELLSYTVDNNGNIRIPYLKEVKAENLRINELAEQLESELSQYIYSPTVKIRIINNRVSILGEVTTPGQYTFNRSSFNIYQAIAMAGDITTFGNRKKVLIVRTEGNVVEKKYVDLTNMKILDSSWYYIRPDDIIYIEPLFRRNFGMDTFSIFDFFSLITTTYTIYFLVSGSNAD